jgi:acetolactate synthase-1/3 small subunit
MRTTLVVFGENTLFTVNRIVSLLRGRRFDVISLTPARTEDQRTTSITIVFDGERARAERARALMEKLDEVDRVALMDRDHSIRRELALVKLNQSPAADAAVERVGGWARVVDRTADTMIVELVGEPEAIDHAVNALREVGILAMTRVGEVALACGPEID